MMLHQLLRNSAKRFPDRIAVVDPGKGEVDYARLDALADRVRGILASHGVGTGDRVGLCAPKSIGSVASIFGILKAGAAYVPVDWSAPPARNGFIFSNCSVKAAVIDRKVVAALGAEAGGEGLTIVAELGEFQAFGADLVVVTGLDGGAAPGDAPGDAVQDLAYILYTSGSTGVPKGVMLSHANALSFIDWCSERFSPDQDDRFSSHAPFHFDLSILDLYTPIKHGAAMVLIGEETGKNPQLLAQVIAEQGITSWYSTPSILRMLVEYGKLERYDYAALRIVHFAGEVFPIKHLRALKEIWTRPRYFNLFGPTETNVCTYYELPAEIPPDRMDPFPIGKVCSGDRAIVLDAESEEVAPGEEGELCICGPSVMKGYWRSAERNAAAFHVDADGLHWYKTGDIVRESGEGDYILVGRRDRMVKRRGYRIELGEVESVLYRHPSVGEAAVVAVPDDDDGVLIKAFLTSSGDEKLTMIMMKQFCAKNLPLYMIPDRFSVQPSLPKTSTDKIDYQSLMDLD